MKFASVSDNTFRSLLQPVSSFLSFFFSFFFLKAEDDRREIISLLSAAMRKSGIDNARLTAVRAARIEALCTGVAKVLASGDAVTQTFSGKSSANKIKKRLSLFFFFFSSPLSLW